MTIAKPDVEGWPASLSGDARYGLAGEFLRITFPHTEADEAALLVQFLAAMGSAIGRGPYYSVEADRHGLNLFAAIVGKSSKARKGTSWGHVERAVRRADDAWSAQTGLSSGEGLIHSVRDGAGITDKRVMIIESEFASMLRAASRNGNTLSAIVRQAWDGCALQVMTRQAPMKATDAHVTIVAHITQSELGKELTSTDSQNGFANRYLWVCAKRSKLLPEGGRVPASEIDSLTEGILKVLSHWRNAQAFEMVRDEASRAYWASVYGHLSGEKPDRYAAFVSRSEAQVIRLSCIYAALDCSTVIKPVHLKAALAVWEYCEASAQYLFGASVADPIEAKIMSALEMNPDGISRTGISKLFSGNRSATEIDRALTSLAEQGKAVQGSPAHSTSGRPEQRWFAVTVAAPARG